MGPTMAVQRKSPVRITIRIPTEKVPGKGPAMTAASQRTQASPVRHPGTVEGRVKRLRGTGRPRVLLKREVLQPTGNRNREREMTTRDDPLTGKSQPHRRREHPREATKRQRGKVVRRAPPNRVTSQAARPVTRKSRRRGKAARRRATARRARNLPMEMKNQQTNPGKASQVPSLPVRVPRGTSRVLRKTVNRTPKKGMLPREKKVLTVQQPTGMPREAVNPMPAVTARQGIPPVTHRGLEIQGKSRMPAVRVLTSPRRFPTRLWVYPTRFQNPMKPGWIMRTR